MKKTTLFAVFVSAGLLLANSPKVSAQITITQSDLPSAGLTVTTEKDSTSALVPGAAGTSQTWNFGALLSQKAATIKFMNAAGSPYAGTYTTATLCDSTLGGNGYNYFISSPSVFTVVGSEQMVTISSNTVQIKMKLNPHYDQAQLPATYGTKFGGTAWGSFTITKAIAPADSEKVHTYIVYSDTVDAWGTMTTPTGTYNVLRSKHDEIDYDSVFIHTFGAWYYYSRTISKYYEYNWYTNGAGYKLVQMDMDSTSATVKDIIWDASAPAGIKTITQTTGINVYPNPCSTQITFQSANQNEQYVTIYDITGRQIEKADMKNGILNVNTAVYAKGMYLYKMTDTNGKSLGEGKFSVQ